jgi:hypothetical protein
MPVLLDAAGSSHADLRQCAVYGVGVGAALAPELFKPHAAAALAAVTSIISAQVGLLFPHRLAELLQEAAWHGCAVCAQMCCLLDLCW